MRGEEGGSGLPGHPIPAATYPPRRQLTDEAPAGALRVSSVSTGRMHWFGFGGFIE